MSCLIAHGRVLDPCSGFDSCSDVLMDAGRIVQIAPAGSLQRNFTGAAYLDARDCWVTPGFIDMHVHLREPGEVHKEDIASGCAAAVFGGYTTLVAMPNTRPVIDRAWGVELVQQRAAAVGLCRVHSAAAVSVGQLGQQLAPFAELQRAGAVALSDDGYPVADAALMRAALEYAQDVDLPVLSHAEEPALTRHCHMHEGSVAAQLGIRGAPRLGEDVAVARDIMLAQYTGARLHICHVSTAAAVELIRQGKAAGVRLSAEATPHHFSLTHTAVQGFQTHAKMNPPLREEADRLAVVAGLRDGTLDAIATDHAPHSRQDKEVAFAAAAHGIIGLQTALPLALNLWRDGTLSPLQLLQRLTYGPAQVLRLPYGRLYVGGDADITVLNPQQRWTFDATTLRSKSRNSPFWQQSMTGQVVATFLAGKLVYRLGKINEEVG